jgi:hypothetical protein
MLHVVRTSLVVSLAALACGGLPVATGAQAEHPPLGKYTVYTFDPYGNAEYAFDFELLTASAEGKPGRYELQMGRVPEAERERWHGNYEYDAGARRLRWLSGPFQRSELYRQDAKNPEGGKVVVKGSRWTVFLNNKARGTSTNR